MFKLSQNNSAPAPVTDLSMEWVRSDKFYELQWSNPSKSHSKITGYHIIVQYPYPESIRNGKRDLPYYREQISYVNREVENKLRLEDVCSTHFDKVNVTIAAYSSGHIGTIIPGKPRDYTFNCSDLLIEGLSIGILSAVGILAGTFISL